MTAADSLTRAGPPATDRRTPEPAGRWLVAAPDAVVMAFLGVCLAVAPLAMAGQFRRWLVLPAIVVVLVLVLGRRLRPEALPAAPGSRLGAAVALLVAAGFVVGNLPSVSEYFVVVRDPAVYTLRAIWLTHHASPNIPVGDAMAGAQGVPGSYVDASGFFLSGDRWLPQGATLVPAVLALGGWVAGDSGVLGANVVVGAVALVAVYALGRRLVGPLWALLPMVVLALSLPMIAFSRAPYTEPTALALGMGGLALLRTALDSGRRAVAAGAGVALGATFLARPDGLLPVLGTTVALGAVTVLTADRARRRRFRRLVRWFLFGATLSIGLAFADLGLNSAPYESTSWGQIKPLTELTVGAALLTVFVTHVRLPAGWRSALIARRERWAVGAAATALVLFGLLALRPLFYTAHHQGSGSADVAARQLAAGAPVDGSRTYDEHSVSWLAWYFGWPLVLLGALGVALLVLAGARRRDPWIASLLAVLAASSVLYLNRPLITPDQIWAVRRFLPVVIPLGLVAAAAVAAFVARRWPRLTLVVALAALGLTLVPLDTWRGVADATQYAHGRAFAGALCDAVGTDHVVIGDDTDGGRIALPMLRVGCGTQAVVLSRTSPDTLRQVRANWPDGRPITVLTFVVQSVPWVATPQQPNLVGRFTVWEEPLTRRPSTTAERTISVYVGHLQPDGRVAVAS
jgi:hypothetical protein